MLSMQGLMQTTASLLLLGLSSALGLQCFRMCTAHLLVHPPLNATPHPPPLCPDIDREILEMQREEQKLIREIKAAAKTGNQVSMPT